jgi:GDPmannose 4,6-dehydratase
MSLQRRALIFGVTGQDGSYLSEYLLSLGYDVHGVTRRSSTPSTSRIDHIINLITLHQSEMTDQGCIYRLIDTIRPHEIYNLAAQSFVHASFDQPIMTGDITGLSVVRILESIRHIDKDIRFFQASSSEMFGKTKICPQNESTPFYPRSPYGVAKLYGHHMTVNYREDYDLYCCSGILYNHESPRRGLEFVTRKISNGVARIKCGLQQKLSLGNLDSWRDWGHAVDYVHAMHLMLQADKPEDYVIGTGINHSVRELVEYAFSHMDLDYTKHVEADARFYRQADTNLLSDPSKARAQLGWAPSTTFKQLVEEMVDYDMQQTMGTLSKII